MKQRVWNFSAGPAALPLPVLEQIRSDLPVLPGAGMSVLEMSHRSDRFGQILGEAEQGLRELLHVPDGFRVLFLQGGASLQFSMAPMNLLPEGGPPGAYVLTGSWGAKAIAEARKQGPVTAAWDGESTGFTSVPNLPRLSGLSVSSYLHVTSNETIQGVQFPSGFEPASGPPLLCDASSDFLSRPLPLERYGLLYAGAQKNAGPAGLTVVLIADALLERIPDGLPSMLDYRTYAASGSLYNTPPVFTIYVLMLVTRWLRDQVGGLEEMQARNRHKAELLYQAIDGSGGFYRGHALPEARSTMNVTFRLPDASLEEAFVDAAAGQGLVGLKGHRSVGGIRASIYNAMPLEGVQTLRTFMERFPARHG
ncbi:MAG TPA: 3-phosphoserine/phosphohydroxythreonine transaminase [Actinomycetota bacterium]|nr:3-phosphoserine/phosphohydroxythreonine transaminase [Actinomycetota bacterium]